MTPWRPWRGAGQPMHGRRRRALARAGERGRGGEDEGAPCLRPCRTPAHVGKPFLGRCRSCGGENICLSLAGRSRRQLHDLLTVSAGFRRGAVVGGPWPVRTQPGRARSRGRALHPLRRHRGRQLRDRRRHLSLPRRKNPRRRHQHAQDVEPPMRRQGRARHQSHRASSSSSTPAPSPSSPSTAPTRNTAARCSW